MTTTLETTSGLTEQQRAALEQLQPLTESERLDARDKARHNVIRKIGKRPTPEQFQNTAAGKYPRWLTGGVGLMLVIVFFAAANVSVFRIFTAGRDHFLETIGIGWQAAIVGASSFLLAEFMVIAATVAMRIYFTNRDRWLMAAPIVLGLAMAFVGNWAISQPTVEFSAAGLWSILETATPPAAVLFMAVIGERLILSALEQRQAANLAFQEALQVWQDATAEPEKRPEWRTTYGNALRDALREKNASGRGKTERESLMASMRGAEWSPVIWREFAADDWLLPQEALAAVNPTQYQPGQPPPELRTVATMRAPALPAANGNGNGRH